MSSITNVAFTKAEITLAGVVRTTIVTTALVTLTVCSYVAAVGKTVAKPHVAKQNISMPSEFTEAVYDDAFRVVVNLSAVKWIAFQALVKEWKGGRGATSSITAMSMHPAYQKILGMGPDAVPFLLAQLRSEGNEPDQWFWALKTITGANPVRTQDQGNYKAMAEAWLAWSESEDYAG